MDAREVFKSNMEYVGIHMESLTDMFHKIEDKVEEDKKEEFRSSYDYWIQKAKKRGELIHQNVNRSCDYISKSILLEICLIFIKYAPELYVSSFMKGNWKTPTMQCVTFVKELANLWYPERQVYGGEQVKAYNKLMQTVFIERF